MGVLNMKNDFKRVKLIFNPGSGPTDQGPVKLIAVIKELQKFEYVAEPYLIEPDCDLQAMVNEAIEQGIQLFVVCGGDGTIATVSKALIGTNAILGIVPMGTQNNMALGLGISADIPEAVSTLLTGRCIKVDIGLVTCEDVCTPFIEVCTVGLLSTLFSSGDDIQHGNYARIGDFFASLTNSTTSEIRLVLDDKTEVQAVGHVVMISNSPYVGRNYQVGASDAFSDGLLDVSFYAALSKFDLIGYILGTPGPDTPEDPRIQHFKVRSIVIKADPPMSVMADGIHLGEGSVRIEVQPNALSVMAGPLVQETLPGTGDDLEQ